MANTIKVKYSAVTTIPQSLAQGELAFSEKDGINALYIGKSDGTVLTIMTAAFLNKLNGIEDGANNYIHPDTHPASMITQSSSYRFVTDTQISSWNAKASTDVATTSANGLMSNTDKAKLDGIAENANNYTHPTGSGYSHIPSGGSAGQVLLNDGDGQAKWGSISTGVTSVAGKTGDVTLTKADVGLDKVDNTSDSEKNVLSATKLTTARTIAGAAFDGTSDISISLANLTTDSTHRVMTDDEKNKLVAVYNWYQAMTTGDDNNIIDTVNEIINAFSGAGEDFNIMSELTNPTNMTLDGGTF